MIKWTFGDLGQLSRLPIDDLRGHDALQSAILCPRHESVDHINSACLELWEGEVVTKHGIDQYADRNDALVVTLEQLNANTPSGSPPQRLDLKVGMPLLLLRNMTKNLMNGTRLLLLEIRPNILKCMILTGAGAGNTVYLPRFTFNHDGTDQPLAWTRRQFPVKPCWAMTINNSQGQTFVRVAVCVIRVVDGENSTVVVDKADVFSHGQLYVALSRCGDPANVCVYTTQSRYNKGTTLNYVWPDALPDHLRSQCAAGGDLTAHDAPFVDVQDDDVMYEPREHMHPHDEPFDVPYHGYVFDPVYGEEWDHSFDITDLEMQMNCPEEEYARWMNDEAFG
jgi:hypothetical protein